MRLLFSNLPKTDRRRSASRAPPIEPQIIVCASVQKVTPQSARRLNPVTGATSEAPSAKSWRQRLKEATRVTQRLLAYCNRYKTVQVRLAAFLPDGCQLFAKRGRTVRDHRYSTRLRIWSRSETRNSNSRSWTSMPIPYFSCGHQRYPHDLRAIGARQDNRRRRSQ